MVSDGEVMMAVQTGTTIPPIDASAPRTTQTATFALG